MRSSFAPPTGPPAGIEFETSARSRCSVQAHVKPLRHSLDTTVWHRGCQDDPKVAKKSPK